MVSKMNKFPTLTLKRNFITALCIAFSYGAHAQTPESCDCEVDTTGLKAYLDVTTLNENGNLQFSVPSASSTFAVLHGVINTGTPTVVQNFISNYPNVTTLVFMQMPGSADDNANLQAAQAIKNAGFKTYLPSVNAYSQDAFIASGAVDMFLSGDLRVIDQGAEVGVHSWSDGSNDATFYPVGHAYHMPYINYYVSMGFSQTEAEDFYYFTINAAPANGIHLMTEQELEQYKLRTCTYSATPSYSVFSSGGNLVASLSNASYQWIDCDNSNMPISGETNQTFTPVSNGNYAVQVTEAGCSGTSPCVSTFLSTPDDILRNLSIYPNPTTDYLNISGIESLHDFKKIEILSLDGKLISEHSVASSKLYLNIVDEGMYFLKIYTKQNVRMIKFLFKH